MPIVNVNYQKPEDFPKLDAATPKMKEYFSKALSCAERQLNKDEISVRYFEVKGNGMLRPVEVNVIAYSYPERVKRQDDICRDARAFIEGEVPSVAPVYVFLQLSELGISG